MIDRVDSTDGMGLRVTTTPATPAEGRGRRDQQGQRTVPLHPLGLDGSAPTGATSVGSVRRDTTPGPPSSASRHRDFARDIVAGDTAAAGLSALVAGLVAWQAGWTPPDPALALPVGALLWALLWPALLGLHRAYETRYLGHGSEELSRVVRSWISALAVVGMGGWVWLPSRLAVDVLVGVCATVLLSIVSRSVLRARLHRDNLAGATYQRVLLVGDQGEVTRLAARIHRNRYHGWHVVAAAGPASPGDPGADSPVRLGGADSVTDVLDAARRCHADLVLLAPSGGSRLVAVDELERALHAEGREVALAPPLVEAVGPRVAVEPVCGLPVLHLSPPELGGPRRVIKGVADRAAASVAVVLLLPVLLAVALLVRLDSKGPALFVQTRVGRHGRAFRIYKFRTMFVDAEARLTALAAQNDGAGPLFKMKSDPRITRVGRFLRRTSLDELPQLLNVVIGDMSLVGPRPPLPAEVEQYDAVTRRRLLVQPGITGLWQVHGRSDLSWEESSRLDVRYVENWSLGFDLSILVRTVRAVVQARGAY
ncbi:exopolysaccharide biosynthesis polyprenyl glycosylphosphotransferase [Aquipuribacter hungaricus]|uniref:Sugar transferase n=1 Tax=Aquipuribacter hungaricus TaxID=545624 RepID=A0ABV7WBW7_9MICO